MPNILDAAAEYRLTKFLSERLAAAHLVLPQPLLDAVRAAAPDAKWRGSTTLDEVPASKQLKKLFVHHPANESGLLAQARARFPHLEVLGLMHHVVPRMACSPRGRQGSLTAKPAEQLPEQRFIVLSPSRAGAMFYSELLGAAGLGAPRELLRPPMVQVWRSRGVNHAAVLDELMRCAPTRTALDPSLGQVLGVRLIGHNLIDAVGAEGVPGALQCLAAQGFRFIHVVRDEVAQAVSRFSARQSGLWQARSALSDEELARMEALPDDLPALLQMHQAACTETRTLAAAVATLPTGSVWPVRFDDFTREPQQAVAEAAHFLGLPADPARIGQADLPHSLSGQLPHLARRAQALRQALAQGQAEAAVAAG